MFMAENKMVRPFGWRDKIGYGLGDFGNDFTFMLIAMFMMKYYTDVMGVSAAVVGLVMMGSRLVDAFTDITMGRIVDKAQQSEAGKFRPWIRRMMGPVALAAVLVFAPFVSDFSLTGRTAWMMVSYLLWGSICYTGINIPYGSMVSAISSNTKDRAQLSVWRSVGSTLAMTGIGVVLPMVVYYRDSAGHTALSSTSMQLTAVACAGLAVVAYALCYHLTTERVKIAPEDKALKAKDMIKGLLTNKALIGIVICAMFLLLGMLSFGNMAAYIFPNYFGNASGQSALNMCHTVVMLSCSVFVVRLVTRFGKKELAIGGIAITAVVYWIMYFLHTKDMMLFVFLCAVSMIGVSIFNLIVWAMITDVIDDTEVRTGYRQDGTIYAVYSFARKMGQALSSGLSGVLLGFIGYTVETAYDPAVIDGIYDITCLAPGIAFTALAIALYFLYPLGKEKVRENTWALVEMQHVKEVQENKIESGDTRLKTETEAY